jgi:RHS repeat-associated protein
MGSGGSQFYYHDDSLGNVSALTSALGALEWRYSYEPFGSARSVEQVDPSAPSNPMRFGGQFLDDSSTYNLRAREYDTDTGRFLQLDTVSMPANAPRAAAYVYANDRPAVMFDPTGKSFEPITDAEDLAYQTTSPSPLIPIACVTHDEFEVGSLFARLRYEVVCREDIRARAEAEILRAKLKRGPWRVTSWRGPKSGMGYVRIRFGIPCLNGRWYKSYSAFVGLLDGEVVTGGDEEQDPLRCG